MSRRDARETRRATVRVLKALVGGPAHVRSGGAAVRLLPESGAGAARAIEIPTALFRRLLADGLVREAAGGRVEAAASARAWLRRALSHGDGFAEQHRETARRGVMAGTEPVEVTVDLSESPLAWLASRRRPDGRPWISETQLAAGERLRADYTRARLIARVTADWGESNHGARRRSGGRGGVGDLTDAALDARDRVHRALSAVGPELSAVLVDVCCQLQGLEAVEKRHAWPARSGKLVLSLALSGLARHYGLQEAAHGPRSAPVRHWGAPDYRPRVDGDGDTGG